MALKRLPNVKESPLGENAFPKISGKKHDFMAGLRHLAITTGLPPILDIEGTVKLHGMHADLVFDLTGLPPAISDARAMKDLEMMALVHGLSESKSRALTPSFPLDVTFQSRNRICEPESSQHGWPRNISKYPDALIYIRDRALTHYTSKNPRNPINPASPMIIAGEWIGPKVQKDVGVSELSARFVIISVQINGVWQKDLDYADIEAPRASIYSIFRSGQHVLKLDTSDLSDTNPTLIKMQSIADTVEACCPFSAAFGVKNARGEGVVWKPGTTEGRADASYWIKTKGPIFGPENRIDATTFEEEAAKKQNMDEVCQRFVSPRRVEQGFEFLLEMGIEPSRTSLKVFVEWIVNDIWLEERTQITKLEEEQRGLEGMLKKKVKWLARCAFMDEMQKCGVSMT